MSQLVQFAVPLFHVFFIFELLSYMIFIINHFLINKEMFNKQYLCLMNISCFIMFNCQLINELAAITRTGPVDSLVIRILSKVIRLL